MKWTVRQEVVLRMSLMKGRKRRRVVEHRGAETDLPVLPQEGMCLSGLPCPWEGVTVEIDSVVWDVLGGTGTIWLKDQVVAQ